MTTNEIVQKKNFHSKSLWIPAIIAFIVTNILFFIDEGYYDFRWMSNIGNWMVFCLYFAFLFGSQVFLRYALLSRFKRHGLVYTLISLVMGLAFAFWAFS